MIDDMISNKQLNHRVAEQSIRGRTLNIYTVFITLSYFAIPITKHVRLYCAHCFIMTISRKQEFQQIAFNRSLDIDFADSMNLY